MRPDGLSHLRLALRSCRSLALGNTRPSPGRRVQQRCPHTPRTPASNNWGVGVNRNGPAPARGSSPSQSELLEIGLRFLELTRTVRSLVWIFSQHDDSESHPGRSAYQRFVPFCCSVTSLMGQNCLSTHLLIATRVSLDFWLPQIKLL